MYTIYNSVRAGAVRTASWCVTAAAQVRDLEQRTLPLHYRLHYRYITGARPGAAHITITLPLPLHCRYITVTLPLHFQVRDLEQRTALHVALDFEGDRHGVDLEVAEMLLAKGAEQVTSLWSRPCVARCLVRGASHTREAP